MKFDNSFMNDANYLAQVSHLFSAYAIVLTAGFFWGKLATALVFAVGMILVSFKEFWYDANYEVPKQTPINNWMDFAFYFAGGFVALFVKVLHG